MDTTPKAPTQQPGGWVDDSLPWEASPLDRPITVTTFTNWAAQTKREINTTLRDLLPLLQSTTADTKGDLP